MTTMNKRRAKTTIQNLPKEIIFDIFSRLPLQAISNCRFLCKDWFEYIAEPDFTTMHHNHNDSRYLLFCWIQAYHRSCYWVSLPDKEEELPIRISLKSFKCSFDPTQKKLGTKLKIIGSINGLICLRYSDDDDGRTNPPPPEFHVCNPITKDIFILPKPPSAKDGIHSASGFGLDSTTSRYKVVHTWYFVNGKSEVVRTEVAIFTLGSEKWRMIPQNIITGSFYFVENKSQAPFLHNALHFKIRSEDPEYALHIGAIDIGSETFKVFEGFRKSLDFCTLYRFEDRLCLTFQSRVGIVLLTMNEYGVSSSWTIRYRLQKDIRGRRILFTKSDKQLLLLGDRDHGYYDLEKNEFKIIQTQGIPPFYSLILDPVIHIGSLISPRRLAAIDSTRSPLLKDNQ